MSQKDLKDQDNLEAQLQNDVELDKKVEVSEDVVDEATIAAKGDAKSANFGQGSDFEDDKKKDLATTSKMPVPKTKSGIISAAVDKLSGMKKEDLQVVFSKLFNEESEEVAQIVEEEVTVVSEEQVQEDLKALVESDSNLSEEFKEKATVLFNSALTARLSEEVQKLEEKKISELAEEVESIRSELVEKIDGYLNYVVEQWMEENELAVETGLRAEIAESFMTQLQQVFVEHYIEVPEGKADLIDDLAEQVEELESKLQESTEKSVKLAEELETLQRAEIIAEASTGLAATEVEKLESLVEGVDYDDAESFAKKVQIVKEAHFKKATVGSIQEEITEDSSEQTTASPRMAAYVSAISRTLK
jgi:hypothetical protein